MVCFVSAAPCIALPAPSAGARLARPSVGGPAVAVGPAVGSVCECPPRRFLTPCCAPALLSFPHLAALAPLRLLLRRLTWLSWVGCFGGLGWGVGRGLGPATQRCGWDLFATLWVGELVRGSSWTTRRFGNSSVPLVRSLLGGGGGIDQFVSAPPSLSWHRCRASALPDPLPVPLSLLIRLARPNRRGHLCRPVEPCVAVRSQCCGVLSDTKQAKCALSAVVRSQCCGALSVLSVGPL